MKKLTAILASVMLIIAMAMPAFAEGYVDSITAKPAPGIVDNGNGTIGSVVDDEDKEVDGIDITDLVITALSDADELPEDAKEELLEVFSKIEDGTMEYPDWLKDLLGDIVVKDLFDVTAVSDRLKDYLEDGNSVQFTLDINIGPDDLVAVASYVDGEWINALECINNGDGTVTVTMSKICPVAVFVKGEGAPQPGEPVGGDGIGEGVCKICHTFFPYLGAAPIFHGVCIICFLLIVLAICVILYIIRKLTKKDEEEEKAEDQK